MGNVGVERAEHRQCQKHPAPLSRTPSVKRVPAMFARIWPQAEQSVSTDQTQLDSWPSQGAETEAAALHRCGGSVEKLDWDLTSHLLRRTF